MKHATDIICVMLLFAAPPVAEAQFTYTTDGSGLSLTGYTGSGGLVVIPSASGGQRVNSIGQGAFSNCTSLISVKIPDTVTTIGCFAFYDCNGLTNVTIPDSVTSIGLEAFYACIGLTNLTIPGGVASIQDAAFAHCYSLTSVTIPDSVTSISETAFFDCTSLTNVTIPDSITSIAESVFDSCTSLNSIILPASVTSTGESAFNNCTSLTNIVLPNGLTSIGEYSFYMCSNLTSITIPPGVTSLQPAAFSGCTRLTEVYFQSNAPIIAALGPFDDTAFNADNAATIYYLAGTTGWTNTYDGVPAVLWNPLIQTGNGNFGVRNNQFGFDITGTPAIPIVVEASTNLAKPVWTLLTNVTLTNGLFHFSEPAQPNTPNRYYRIASP